MAIVTALLLAGLPVCISAWDVALGILSGGACVVAAIALACMSALAIQK